MPRFRLYIERRDTDRLIGTRRTFNARTKAEAIAKAARAVARSRIRRLAWSLVEEETPAVRFIAR